MGNEVGIYSQLADLANQTETVLMLLKRVPTRVHGYLRCDTDQSVDAANTGEE